MEYSQYLENMARYVVNDEFALEFQFTIYASELEYFCTLSTDKHFQVFQAFLTVPGCRDGEWGDHVSLQAAADLVISRHCNN
jgi:hypothetical protein